MAVPKKKTSKSRRNMRRAHHSLEEVQITIDKETGDPRLPHHVNLPHQIYRGHKLKPKVKVHKEEN